MAEIDQNLFWAIWYRAFQGGLECAPTLLIGMVFAGLVRGLIGAEAARRWFTNDPIVGPLRAGITGFLLPVCSFGVLPVAWELRRAGIARGTVITLVLAAPLADAFSVIYAYQLLSVHGPLVLVAFAAVLAISIAISLGIGIAIGRLIPESAETPAPQSLPMAETRRAGIAVLTSARGLSGRLLLFLSIGLVGSGLLAVVRGGALERTVNDSSLRSTVQLAGVALPAYAPTTKGTAIACELLLAGQPLGRVLLFVMLGVGLNLGTLAWIASTYGIRTFVGTVPIVVGLALGIACALPITAPGLRSDDGTGFRSLEIEASGTPRMARMRAIQTTLTNERGERQWLSIAACGAIGCLALGGLFARLLGPVGTSEYWFQNNDVPRRDTREGRAGWRLTSAQLSIAIAAIIAASVCAGLFVYFPAHDDLLNDMDDVEIELGRTLKVDGFDPAAAVRLVDRWQAIEQKLLIARVFRGDAFDAKLKTASSELRSGVERLRQGLREKLSPDELEPLFQQARQAADRYSDAANRKHSS